MSVLKAEDSRKWINSLVAAASALVSYLTISFMGQLGEWFDLEAGIGDYRLVSQGVGIVLGLASFLVVTRNRKAMTHMEEVYSELVKAVWPGNDSVVRFTVGIIIALAIVSGIFVGVDFSFNKFLDLFY